MSSIITHFDKAFRAEIQKKSNWHFGKPVETRLNIEIWKKLYLANNLKFSSEQCDKVIFGELVESMSEFKGQTLEQVQTFFEEAQL